MVPHEVITHCSPTNLACSASSMSLQPGGSTLQTHRCRRSSRPGSLTCSSVTFQGSGGTQSCTAGVKGVVMMSFSISSTSCKVQATCGRGTGRFRGCARGVDGCRRCPELYTHTLLLQSPCPCLQSFPVCERSGPRASAPLTENIRKWAQQVCPELYVSVPLSPIVPSVRT